MQCLNGTGRLGSGTPQERSDTFALPARRKLVFSRNKFQNLLIINNKAVQATIMFNITVVPTFLVVKNKFFLARLLGTDFSKLEALIRLFTNMNENERSITTKINNIILDASPIAETTLSIIKYCLHYQLCLHVLSEFSQFFTVSIF